MTMWNEADEYWKEYRRSHEYDYYTLPIDNPKSVNHDVYQHAVNRFTGVFIFLLTVFQITLTGSWSTVLAILVGILAGIFVILLLGAVIFFAIPPAWRWLKGM